MFIWFYDLLFCLIIGIIFMGYVPRLKMIMTGEIYKDSKDICENYCIYNIKIHYFIFRLFFIYLVATLYYYLIFIMD
eukprot:UN04354